MSAEIRASYEELLGHVPETVEHRIALATEAGHPASVDAIEAFRVELLHRNQLDPRTQQLVHFALLIGAGHEGPASIHARGALHNGATNTDLYGVCTTAAVTGGMPAYSRCVDIVRSTTRDSR